MKSIHGISKAYILTVSMILFYSCIEKPEPPSVETIPVSSVSFTSAASGGAVTYEGGSPVTGRGVCWNTSSDPTIAHSITTQTGGFGAFTCDITQLVPNTLYYVRAWATNDAGTGYGKQVTFTTRQSEPPVIATAAITSVTQTRAISGGNITNENGATVAARGVCWSTSADPTTALSTKTTDGTGSGSFSSYITQLVPGTPYYVRAYATNTAGTSYGSQVLFTTSPLAIPSLTTSAITSITPAGAVSGGEITNEGGTITESGICWDSLPDPTTELITKTTDGTGYGSFVCNITGLLPGSTYYVRAYAVNEAGTSYGNQIMFNTKIADIDGNTYNTVRIGNQVWMAENLKTTRYNDDSFIPFIIDNSVWAGLTTPGYSWYNNDANTYKDTYGALYNWYALDTASNGVKNVCPTGWHIPADIEWIILISYLGGENVAGGKLKEAGTVHWQSPNTGATNESGFTALPGGRRDWYSPFAGIKDNCYWWSSTREVAGDRAWHIFLDAGTAGLALQANSKVHGFSARCLRDN
jgi:uncharacterized protein (TIGR02145 family)